MIKAGVYKGEEILRVPSGAIRIRTEDARTLRLNVIVPNSLSIMAGTALFPIYYV
jgi:hypothetical protein